MSTQALQKSFDEIMSAARRSRSTGKSPAWLEEKRREAIANLKGDFPNGGTVFMVLRKRAASGMKHVYSIISIKKDGKRMYAIHPNYSVALATGLTFEKTPGGNDGIVMKGAGYNKPDSIAEELSQALYGHGRGLKAELL
jgi:hypothetical protein